MRRLKSMAGRAGLIRPLASPFGPAQALSKIDWAILSNLNAGYSPTRSVRYAMPGFGESAEVSERMVGRAGLIRPLASPFGPAQALSKIDGAILSNLNAASHPHDPCVMQCQGLGKVLRYRKEWWVVRD
ncbi:hypothetical protein M621_06480 [Serratia plymuthica S13]|uniref:Uncharacterized protein n=1 Tax=Serratia plymuthica S13 TaxID=1348660 RepID=S4YRB0_SERPL|nr:hypothetical protein M621_06480 [Serratia plymuthica S13]ANJ97589.1 hypothetical protein ADP73_06415 [Serratia plymuthica]